MTKYPTQSEICAYLPPADPAEADFCRSWPVIGTQLDAVKFARAFASTFGILVTVKIGPRDLFRHVSRTLEISTPSMLVVLHELAHARYGHSELIADRYAVSLLLAAYPNAQTSWDGRKLLLTS